MTEKKEPNTELRLIIKPESTSHTDMVKTILRADGSVLAQFISVVDNLQLENHRTVFPKKIVESFIDNLCKMMNYYPAKPKTKRQTKKKS